MREGMRSLTEYYYLHMILYLYSLPFFVHGLTQFINTKCFESYLKCFIFRSYHRWYCNALNNQNQFRDTGY